MTKWLTGDTKAGSDWVRNAIELEWPECLVVKRGFWCDSRDLCSLSPISLSLNMTTNGSLPLTIAVAWKTEEKMSHFKCEISINLLDWIECLNPTKQAEIE